MHMIIRLYISLKRGWNKLNILIDNRHKIYHPHRKVNLKKSRKRRWINRNIPKDNIHKRCHLIFKIAHSIYNSKNKAWNNPIYNRNKIKKVHRINRLYNSLKRLCHKKSNLVDNSIKICHKVILVHRKRG